MLEQIKNLNLTEKDFQLLVDGLDALPHKNRAGNLMVDILGAVTTANRSEETKEEFMKKIEERDKRQERERLAIMDDIRILQGKLLMMKRYMIENNLLKEANDIINK